MMLRRVLPQSFPVWLLRCTFFFIPTKRKCWRQNTTTVLPTKRTKEVSSQAMGQTKDCIFILFEIHESYFLQFLVIIFWSVSIEKVFLNRVTIKNSLILHIEIHVTVLKKLNLIEINLLYSLISNQRCQSIEDKVYRWRGGHS